MTIEAKDATSSHYLRKYFYYVHVPYLDLSLMFSVVLYSYKIVVHCHMFFPSSGERRFERKPLVSSDVSHKAETKTLRLKSSTNACAHVLYDSPGKSCYVPTAPTVHCHSHGEVVSQHVNPLQDERRVYGGPNGLLAPIV